MKIVGFIKKIFIHFTFYILINNNDSIYQIFLQIELIPLFRQVYPGETKQFMQPYP
jgi:hypothetical protein